VVVVVVMVVVVVVVVMVVVLLDVPPPLPTIQSSHTIARSMINFARSLLQAVRFNVAARSVDHLHTSLPPAALRILKKQERAQTVGDDPLGHTQVQMQCVDEVVGAAEAVGEGEAVEQVRINTRLRHLVAQLLITELRRFASRVQSAKARYPPPPHTHTHTTPSHAFTPRTRYLPVQHTLVLHSRLH
jgi:hypothetical protein